MRLRDRLGFFSVLTAAGLTACNPSPTQEANNSFPPAVEQARTTSTSNLSGTVAVDGSSTVFPISKAMSEAFRKANPNVQVTVNVSGTGGGFKKFCANQTDISGASRPINAEELELCRQNNVEYIEMPIAFDGLAVAVNSQNTFAKCLKMDELKQMWEPAAEGKVTTWNQVNSGFPNQPLKLLGPDKDSGTYDYFTLAVVGEEGKSRSDYTPSKSDDVLVQGVAADPNAIGFFSYGYYLANRDKLNLVAVNTGAGCVQPSIETITDSRYQPLSRPVFIYVKKSAATRPEVKAFSTFYLEPENANLILQSGEVPLPNISARAAISRLENGETGTKFGGTGSILGVKR